VNNRGTALVETAFVMSIVLMIIFGSIQLSVLAYTQVSQDGAAFVASRTYAQDPAAGTVGAAAAAHTVFTHVPAAAIAVTPSANAVSVVVTGASNGLPVAGSPATFAVNAHVNEPGGAATPAPASPYPFSATATLQNYFTSPGDTYAVAGLNQPRTILLTQSVALSKPAGSRFAEWYCRAAVYAAIAPPATTANGALYCYYDFWCFFDPMRAFSPMDPIYDWDTGTTCA
jgi:TadE-like protein